MKCLFRPNVQVSQLLINSHKLKHEVSRNSLLILYIVFSVTQYFYLYIQSQGSVISLILLKNVEASLPKFLTNQTFWGYAFTPCSYATASG